MSSKVRSVRLPESLWLALDVIAKEQDTTVNAIVQAALERLTAAADAPYPPSPALARRSAPAMKLPASARPAPGEDGRPMLRDKDGNRRKTLAGFDRETGKPIYR